jgi:hypothetical protein
VKRAADPVIPPHDLDAERAVLGLLLRDEGGPLLPLVRERLTADDFFENGHGAIFTAILRVAATAPVVDVIVLARDLESHESWESLDTKQRLALIYDQGAVPALVEKYIAIILELSAKRELVYFAATLDRAAQNGHAAEALLDDMRATIHRLEARAVPESEPTLHREGLDLALEWPSGVRCALTAIRDSREGVRGELTVTQDARRLSWGSFALASTAAREALRKRLEATAPGVPWGDYLEAMAWQLTQAAREGEPLVTLTDAAVSPTRELVPRLLYEGEPTQIYAHGDTGKSLVAQALAVAVHTGRALPFGLKPARAVPVAILDYETSRGAASPRSALISAGLGVDPPSILYKRMTRPLVDEADALAAEFARRGIGFVIVDSLMFAVAGGEGSAFHEPITAFYNALRLFAPAATLILNHITGADARSGGPPYPYGGAFAWNGPRLSWELKRDRDVEDATALVFTNRKANNFPRLFDPFGLEFRPGPGTITILPLDLTQAAPKTTAGASLAWRIKTALAAKDMRAPDLAKYLDVDKPESVTRTLNRLKGSGAVSLLPGDLWHLSTGTGHVR